MRSPWRRVRNTFIRLALLAVLVTVGYAAWWAQDWVSPENVRAAVETKIQSTFPTAQVNVGTARMRLLGGISVTDLVVTKSGDKDPIFSAPVAVIHHEKEKLNNGKLVVRKIDLEAPVIRLERAADGTWNTDGLASKEQDDSQAMPTLLAHNATIHVVDHSPSGLPPFTISNARLQIINDPLPILLVEASGTVSVGTAGQTWDIQATVSAKYNRITKQAALKLEVPEVTLNAQLAKAIAKLNPSLSVAMEKLTATVGVKAEVAYTPNLPSPWKTDIKLDVKTARYEDAMLPWAMENISGQVRFADGRLKIEKATATFGPARVELALETREDSQDVVNGDDVFCILEDRLQMLTMTARNLPLSKELFERLPERAQLLKKKYAPQGHVDVTYKFTRPGKGWRRDVDIRPNGLTMAYEKFNYPVADLSGSLKKLVASDGTDEMAIQLSGIAAGRKIDIVGRVSGSGEDPFVDVKVSGDDIPLDEKLINAIPTERHRNTLNKLHAVGRGNFVATIKQGLNQNRMDSVFSITITDGKINYDVFPYPLDKLRGDVVISLSSSTEGRDTPGGLPLPSDRFELVNFTAMHGPGQIWLSGVNERDGVGPNRKLVLGIKGKNCPADDDLRNALSAIKVGNVWRMLDPKGSMTFACDCVITDRVGVNNQPDPAFDPATDLKLTLNFKGPTVTPDFFAYELKDLSGMVRYQNNQVDLLDFSANHGNSLWALRAAEIRFNPSGSTWINMGGIAVTPVVLDEAFFTALPKGLKDGLKEIALKGPADLHVRHMVVSVPSDAVASAVMPGVKVRAQAPSLATPTPDPDPIIYWDAKLTMMGVSFDTGLPWESAHGTLGCIGRYEGTHLGAIVGNVWLERAFVAGQPLAKLQTRVTVEPQQKHPTRPGVYEPVAIQFHDAAGTLFHGFVGGEAHVSLTTPTRYRLWLTASDVRLDEMAKHYKLGKDAELKGYAQARILLENQPDPKTGEYKLRGEGSVDVPTGRMYNLPVLLDLVKLAKFQAPDQTAFEEAHAVFKIQGDRIKVEHLDLVGSAVSLGGEGELDSSGKYVKFEFYTIWSQTLKRWLTTPFGDITAAVSDKLFRIEMSRAADGTLKYDPRVVPVVTDPVRAIADRFRKRKPATELAPNTRPNP